jgi:hypothetical protein
MKKLILITFLLLRLQNGFSQSYFSYDTIVLPFNSKNSEELFVIDYNSDNKKDFFVPRLAWPPTYPATYSPIQCVRNNGAMSFTNESPIIGFDSLVHPRDYAIADFNGDGKSDIIIADHGTDVNPFPGGQNRLYLQNANGKLVESSLGNIPAVLDFTHNIATADIDNDGDQDMFVCNIWGQQQIGPRLMINNGSGQFTVNTLNLPSNIVNLSIKYMSSRFADIDKDGDMDLILGATDDVGLLSDAILLNNGSGVFSNSTIALPPRNGGSNWGTVAIATIDVNNDTWPDLIMSTLYQYQTCNLQLLVNNRDGTFSDSTQNIPQSWPTSNAWIKWIEKGDFNNDGWIDFVVCLFAGQPVLYLNTGNTKFTDASFLLSSSITNTASYRTSDFDNDGLLDIAFMDFSGNIIIAKNLQPYSISIDSSAAINLSSFPSSAGNTSGGGVYQLGQTIPLNAVPNTGWAFVNWTDNTTVISTNASLNYLVNYGTNLVANFSLTTSVNEEGELKNKIQISPNPFSAQTTLLTDKILKDATLTVYNSFGQQVKQIKNISGQTVTLFRDNLASGLYFVRLTQDSKIISADKLVITD